ncbi:uncharacterized protein METZ01_LOCUS386025, partial [marine metagenome]
KSDAWRLARHHKNHLQEKIFFTPEDQLPVLRKATLKNVRSFARKQLFRQGQVEALVHGNFTAVEAIAATRSLVKKLGLRPISTGGKAYEKELLVMEASESLLRIHKLEVNNSAFWREYDIAIDAPDTRAATLVIDNFVSQPFYNEMRTKQQLGYIVWGGSSRKEDRLLSYFIIQSGTHPADELQNRADTFLATLPDRFKALTDEEFERLKNAAREKVKEKPKSIAEKASGIFTRAYDHDGDFDREQTTLRAIDELTKSQTLKLLRDMLGEETRRQRTLLLFAKEHESKKSIHP